jgi:hypothetical protein
VPQSHEIETVPDIVQRRSNQIANWLIQMGIGPGSHVSYLGRARPASPPSR